MAKVNRGRAAKKHAGRLVGPMRVRAIEVVQTKFKLYLFKAAASDLYKALSINRKAENKDEGYQRVLSVSRVDAIKRYLEKRPIPGAIIVALDSEASFNKAKQELIIPDGRDVGWVIDGQHRLVGAHLASGEGLHIELPVVAFIGLNDLMQIEQFVTINREAKNVPTSLYLDLLHHLPNKKAGDIAKERAADLATELRKNEESPFFERIVVTSAPKSGQTISLTNFVRKISPHVAPHKGILGAYTEKEQIGVVSNYFQGLRQIFPKEYEAKDSMFFKTIGFGALWNIFPTFFSLTLKEQNGFTVGNVATVFKRIENYDFSVLTQFGVGDAAERMAADELKTALLLASNPTDTSPALKLH